MYPQQKYQNQIALWTQVKQAGAAIRFACISHPCNDETVNGCAGHGYQESKCSDSFIPQWAKQIWGATRRFQKIQRLSGQHNPNRVVWPSATEERGAEAEPHESVESRMRSCLEDESWRSGWEGKSRKWLRQRKNTARSWTSWESNKDGYIKIEGGDSLIWKVLSEQSSAFGGVQCCWNDCRRHSSYFVEISLPIFYVRCMCMFTCMVDHSIIKLESWWRCTNGRWCCC